MFDKSPNSSYYIMRYLNTFSSWFDSSLTASLFRSAARLGERVPQEVPGGGWSRAGEARQEGCTGVADQRDPANRLRIDSCAVQSLSPEVLYDQLLCSDNRL